MIIIALRQPPFGNLLQNTNEATHKILVRVGINRYEIKEGAKRRPHHPRIIITQPLPKIRHQIRNRPGGLLVKPVQRHNGLLPNGLLGMPQELNNLRQNGGDRLVVYELTDGVEGGANDEVVVGAEILLDGVDNEDDEVVVVAEEERDGEVPGALEGEGIVVGHLDSVDVAKGGVVAEHLHVQEADDVLLHLALRDVGLQQAPLEGFDLAEDDAVLLRLGSGLAYGLHEI